MLVIGSESIGDPSQLASTPHATAMSASLGARAESLQVLNRAEPRQFLRCITIPPAKTTIVRGH
jgi:hypothetical protein